MSESMEAPLPLGLDQETFNRVAAEVISEIWRPNPGGLASVSVLTHALIGACHRAAAGYRDRNLTAKDLEDHFRLSPGQAHYAARILRDPALDRQVSKLSDESRKHIRKQLLTAIGEDGKVTECVFYISRGAGDELKQVLAFTLDAEPAPSPGLAKHNGCYRVNLKIGVLEGSKDDESFTADLEFITLCSVLSESEEKHPAHWESTGGKGEGE